jgi:hypothetical protein
MLQLFAPAKFLWSVLNIFGFYGLKCLAREAVRGRAVVRNFISSLKEIKEICVTQVGTRVSNSTVSN